MLRTRWQAGCDFELEVLTRCLSSALYRSTYHVEKDGEERAFTVGCDTGKGKQLYVQQEVDGTKEYVDG